MFKSDLNDTSYYVPLLLERHPILGETSIVTENSIITIPAEKIFVFLNKTHDLHTVLSNYTVDRTLREFLGPINYLSYYNDFNKVKSFENDIKMNYQESLNWFCLKYSQEAIEKSNLNDFNYRLSELDAIRSSISLIFEDEYGAPKVFNTPPIIYLEKNSDSSQKYTLEMLSDGYRAMLALIMDLVRHMAEVAPFCLPKGQSCLETPAIVLIDEIELHLHPKWQQTVLPTLLKIFPKTQFIVTTNSPQVLTSIPSRQIRLLDNGEIYSLNEVQTEGAEAGQVLLDIMGVEQRPKKNKMVKKLDEYTELISKEQFDERTFALKKELYDHFGANDAQLLELDLISQHIKRRKEVEEYFKDK
jgi:hypothetical protein